MLGYLVLAFVAYVLFKTTKSLISWRSNYLEAKKSGLPVYIVPINCYNRLWTILGEPISKQLRKIFPESWLEPWLTLSLPLHGWYDGYSTFKDIGSDAYITVSPVRNVLWICDPGAVSQITQRRNDFPKPVHMYGVVDIFGKNVVSSEGQYWRHHRKIVAPPFNEKNNHLVWIESLHQGHNMLRGWTGMDGNESKTIETLQRDSMRLSLYVISKAGFGKALLWPGVETPADGDTSKDANTLLTGGHVLTYVDALGMFLRNLVMVLLLPHNILRVSPIKRMREAYVSYVEWKNYMSEMYTEKKEEMEAGKGGDGGLDLMGAMIKAAGVTEKDARPLLSQSEIMGNAFVFILAGHETTANTIHFSLVKLAMGLTTQRHLQAELDTILGDKPISEWSYDRDLPKLFGGMVGACMAEILRLIPAVNELPKSTVTAQSLTIDGKPYTIPGGSLVNLSTTPSHRNPKYWPHGPPTDPNDPHHPRSNLDNDLEEFKPERWLQNDASAATAEVSGTGAADQGDRTAETDDLGVNTAADTAATLFKPVKGSYFPFSEGYRSCIGRRFAQVEYMAVLAVIFRDYSIELAVDEWATDEEVEAMTPEQRREVWNKAYRAARKSFVDDFFAAVTLQLKPGKKFPVRFVRRGKERFDWGSQNP